MTRETQWAAHAEQWRDPAEVVSYPPGTPQPDPRALHARVRGAWWDTLASLGITLLVTREYEHLLMALAAPKGRPRVTYLPIPHPSGLARSSDGGLFVASTRNPNQVFELRPTAGLVDQFFNDSTGQGDHGEIDARGPWNEGGKWTIVENPQLEQGVENLEGSNDRGADPRKVHGARDFKKPTLKKKSA